jgi:hypothetical protein
MIVDGVVLEPLPNAGDASRAWVSFFLITSTEKCYPTTGSLAGYST